MKTGNTVSAIHILDQATVNQIAAGEVWSGLHRL